MQNKKNKYLEEARVNMMEVVATVMTIVKIEYGLEIEAKKLHDFIYQVASELPDGTLLNGFLGVVKNDLAFIVLDNGKYNWAVSEGFSAEQIWEQVGPFSCIYR